MNTKEKLIEESLKVFLEHGFDNFSMRDVSKKVGIKQPTMYYHFKDKLDLFRKCIKFFFDKWYVWLAQSFVEEPNLKSLVYNTCMSFALDNDIVEQLYGVKTVTGQYRLIFDVMTYCPECMQYMKAFNEDYFELLDKLTQQAKQDHQIREETTTHSIYILLGSLIEGSNIMRLTDPDLDFARHTENIFNIIWHGLAPTHP